MSNSMTDNSKQYIGHDIEALDDAGNYYSRHVNAMTAENLFSKSDIAAELGYRDKRIDDLLAALEEKDQRIKEFERITEGVDQLAIDGGWTARKMSEYAKSLETRNAELERANAAQDDHINQQQDRIDTLEKKNDELGKHVSKQEKLLKCTEESLIASVDNVAELERRLQQPIKLPDIRSEDYHESGWFQHMKYYRDVVRSIQVLELKVEGE